MRFSKARSIPLTRRAIEGADVVYAMTRSHAGAVLSIDPEAEVKVRLLDPEGHDIPDPLGAPQHVYTETARRIRDLLERRIKEQSL